LLLSKLKDYVTLKPKVGIWLSLKPMCSLYIYIYTHTHTKREKKKERKRLIERDDKVRVRGRVNGTNETPNF
jgi:hypothetical protein